VSGVICGATVDAVKVGTIKHAKGLEFKQVLMADVRRDDAGARRAVGRGRVTVVLAVRTLALSQGGG